MVVMKTDLNEINPSALKSLTKFLKEYIGRCAIGSEGFYEYLGICTSILNISSVYGDLIWNHYDRK